ncbi:MAG: hypothetical protein AABZ30_11160 [Myxococcota bacterium]
MLLHPRVEEQRIVDDGLRRRVAAGLPQLVPFRAPAYAALRTVLDWDHHLPSSALVARVFAYRSAEAAVAGASAIDRRLALIRTQNRFPEFDVPDFEGLPADETYQAGVSLDGKVDDPRLVSEWRRAVSERDARAALAAVRLSIELARIREEFPARQAFLGEPQVAQWVPPFEGDHSRWTVDVWYLLAVRGQEADGRSFLVDADEGRVVRMREIIVQMD